MSDSRLRPRTAAVLAICALGVSALTACQADDPVSRADASDPTQPGASSSSAAPVPALRS